MRLQLRYYGDPILRVKSAPVEAITDEIRTLVVNMVETMEACGNAIGLAAPQVGVPLRLFMSPVGPDHPNGEPNYNGEMTAYINPILTEPSDFLSEMNEGCLSIPDLYVPVMRPEAITIEYTTIEGLRVSKRVTGFLARNLMHENDHLNGVLTVDRVKGKKRTQLDPELRAIKQKYCSR